MIELSCKKCHQPLIEPGGLLFTQPNASEQVQKWHLCLACLRDVKEMILGGRTGLNPEGEDMATASQVGKTGEGERVRSAESARRKKPTSKPTYDQLVSLLWELVDELNLYDGVAQTTGRSKPVARCMASSGLG